MFDDAYEGVEVETARVEREACEVAEIPFIESESVRALGARLVPEKKRGA